MLYQHVPRPFWRRHPVAVAVVSAVAAWWLWHGWYESLAFAVAIGALVVLRRRRRALAIRNSGLLARAEYEHRLSLAGDPRGTFGRYPPVQAGWYRNPENLSQMRYFDGATWTPQVRWR
jgi:hypothetical protein